MKQIKIFPLLFLIASPFMAQSVFASEIISNVKLDKVTLFMKGAELQGSSTIAVPKGESEILLTQIANSINAETINIGVGDEAMILSTSLVDNYLVKKTESDSVLALRQSLKQLEKEQAALNIKLSVVNEEIALLKDNRLDALTKSNGSLADAKQVMNFVKENLTVALTEQQSTVSQLDELKTNIKHYQAQIELEDGSSSRVQNAIRVKVFAKEAISLPLSLSYVTSEAGWIPNYDVRVKDINSPIQLTYNANVYQYSGLNWNNIDFTLSTSNPSEGIMAPTPTPWYISIYDGKFSGNLKQYKSTPSRSYVDDFASTENKEASNFTDYVVSSNNGINALYNIKLPYTIYNNSSDNILTLKEKQVAAEYRYIATPKLDNSAFLQAQIADWDKLELLPGNSTVFYADNYVGSGYITTKGVKDKLNISLGRDKTILISRNQDTNETSKPSFFGNDISQKFAYNIDVKNTKDRAITITIYDQLPVIQNKIIKMDDIKYDGASYDKETGLLTWNIPLKSKETKRLSFSFKLSYPNNKSNDIIGL